MTDQEFDRRITRLTEHQEALAESQELLAATVLELGSIVRGMLTDRAEQRERDKRHMQALAQFLSSWAGNGEQQG